MKNITKFIFVLFLTVSSSLLFAENAKVTYIKGKVELNKNDTWVALKVGDEITNSDTISTGFQSEAKIEYKGSIMSLGALTRITLEKLSSSESKDDVSVYLKTGAVRSKVTHPQGKRVSYTVKTPVAVASVRGTDFTVTSNGHISCSDGAVAVYANKDRYNASKKSSSRSESEEETEVVDTIPADSNPATATTKAQDIDSTAPAGTVVVGKNQAVAIQVTGNPENPIANAIRKNETVKNSVSTAADQEGVSIGGSGTVAKTIKENVTDTTTNTVTSLSIKVVIED